MEKQYFVYLLTNKPQGSLYTGVTSNLLQRVYQHKNNLADGFTKKYGIHRLVYYELHIDINDAITREKRIQRWHRQWKIDLIEQSNPQWLDLSKELF